ncbi:cupin-like domain-containing protein [Arcticibacterium luteifluviistationis]|uniref:Cupin-like domain-containing protein n=1 Tax=Arcticibacterium luteifluviistationis TaxID=1784714 RepID=A0A2Z4GF68_9BACT|nr:cupin-like domain-containing protein [Arcticibacterium luteifluviistationis]AWV99433.1 cupin-like domain-containing protein [Arcticibacterium luteifluviistationis]
MHLEAIERRSNLSREEFIESYLKPKKPVIFTDLVKDWPAREKWTFDWLKENHGNLEVPLIDKHYHDPDKYFQIAKKMKFGDYLDLIQAGPVDLRIFLFDIFKKIPELAEDIRYPTIMDGFIKSYKFMFFGGQDSVTSLHYDMDCSNVFLTQFQTKKKVILFGPDQSKKLYKHPYTVMSHFDPENPDFDRFPAAKNLVGQEGVFGHGETVFIPSLWWHHIRYVDGGFSLALRANDSVFTTLKGGMFLARHSIVDRGMTKVLGKKWKEWKESKASENAMEFL